MKILNFFEKKSLSGIAIVVFFFILYSITLAPTVTFIDSGELSTVCCILGIAHPTGYPLFTILGYLFSRFPFIDSEVYKLNLMCALFCSFSLFFVYKLMFLFNDEIITSLKKNAKSFAKKNVKKKPASTGNITFRKEVLWVSAVSAVISLGLSKNFWEQSTSIEVYPLHCLLIGILLFLFAKNIFNLDVPKTEITPYLKRELNWFIFALFLGFGFTNHMSTIFLIPAFFYLYVNKYGFGTDSIKRVLLMLIPFFIGLSLYLYLPLRASQNPEINWGNPSTFEYFVRHISGKQYQVWMFSSFSEAIKQLKYFIKTVPADFIYFPIFLSIFGLVYLFQNGKKIFYFTLILFLTCLLMAINYDINDIDSYFLLSYFVIAMWSGFGIIKIFLLISLKVNNLKPSFIFAFIFIPLFQIINFSDVNESNNYLVEDYTMNLFDSVKENGLVISYQWDNWISASLYFQHVKNIRRDIVVIDKELLRRSWYFNQLKRNYPEIIEKSRVEIDRFLNELYKFEHDLPYDPLTIQTTYINMINSIIEKNYSSRPIYVTNEIEKEIGSNYYRIPEGLVNRLYQDNNYHEFTQIVYRFRQFKDQDKYVKNLVQFYISMLTQRASYENFYGNHEKASWCLAKASEISPEFYPANHLKGQPKK